MLPMNTHNSHKLLKKLWVTVQKKIIQQWLYCNITEVSLRALSWLLLKEFAKSENTPPEAISHVHVVLVCHVTIPHPHSTLPQCLWSLLSARVLTSATTNCKNYSRNVWRFWLEELAEKWPIILKYCSMLGDTYNTQKNASIIYLGLAGTLTWVPIL